MAMNRIPFQAGLSLPSFLEQYGTEAQCEAALELARWHQGFRCPACGEAGHYVLKGRTHKTFQCKDCRLQTSLIAGDVVSQYAFGTAPLVFGNLLGQSSQDGLISSGFDAAVGCELFDRLAKPRSATWLRQAEESC
jgi:predicted RNA-binding Zn-ribbon protein involved in translation (DUF1610 family)